MRAGVRDAINRLLAIGLFAGLFVVGFTAAVEAAAALIGAGSQLDPPIPYAQWWADLDDVSLSETELAAIAIGAVIVAAGILLFEFWPRRRDRRRTIAQEPTGQTQLRTRSVQPYLSDRLGALGWVRDPDVRVKVRGGTARVDARPLAGRQVDEDEIEAARELLAACAAEVGLDAGSVAVKPRTDRKTLRVR